MEHLNEQLFGQLSSRDYRQFPTCQLPGCNRELNKTSRKRRNKYCCDEHATEAKKLYKKLWEEKNPEKVKEWKKNYYHTTYKLKRNARKKNKTTKFQKHYAECV